MSKERRTKLLIALLGIGLSSLAVVPFFFMGQSEGGGAFELRMPTTHDMFLHYDQMKSFYNGLAAGEIYPRWEEDTNRGFGAPTTSFYPPGSLLSDLGILPSHGRLAADAFGRATADDDRFGGSVVLLRPASDGPRGGDYRDDCVRFFSLPSDRPVSSRRHR